MKRSEFMARIEKYAQTNDAKAMLLITLAYSEELENEQPETSLQLLALAEGLVEDINNADKKTKEPFPLVPSLR